MLMFGITHAQLLGDLNPRFSVPSVSVGEPSEFGMPACRTAGERWSQVDPAAGLLQGPKGNRYELALEPAS